MADQPQSSPPPPPIRTPPATPGGYSEHSSASPSHSARCKEAPANGAPINNGIAPDSSPRNHTPRSPQNETSMSPREEPMSPPQWPPRGSSSMSGYESPGEPPYSPPPPPPEGILRGMAPAQYQKHLPHFSGQYSTRVTSLQSNDSRDLQMPSPDMILNGRLYDDPNFAEPLPSPSIGKPQQIHQGVPMPLPHSGVISSGESRSSKGSISYFPDNVRMDSPMNQPFEGEDNGQQSMGYQAQQAQRSQKQYPQLQSSHQQHTHNDSTNSLPNGGVITPGTEGSSTPPSESMPRPSRHLTPNTAYRAVSRPLSTYSMGPDTRTRSPQGSSPNLVTEFFVVWIGDGP